MEHEYMALDELRIGLLRNQVHALFSESLRTAVPDYSVVEQSAKLASHFVECGVLDRLFLAIWDNGKHGRGWRSRTNPNKVGYEYPPEDLDETVPITPADRIRVRKLLKTLSDNIYYRVDDKADAHAITHSLINDKVPDKSFSKGERSRVKISVNIYNALRTAQCGKDAALLLRLQFEFAVVLVHEIGHALDNLCHGQLTWHHFFGENAICETGFEIENRLFGGHLTMVYEGWEDPKKYNRYHHGGQRSSMSGVLVLWEYPYQGVVAAYGNHGLLQERGELKAIRRFDVAWRVPITFLQRFFEESFWASEFPANKNALRPKCSTGYCFRVDRYGASIPVTINREKDAMMCVPPGYRQLKSGDIVPHHQQKRLREAAGGFADTTLFWRKHAAKFSSGELLRPWIAVPFEDIPPDEGAISEDSELSDAPSDMDID